MSSKRKFKVGDRVRILNGTRTGEVRTVASIRPPGLLRLADDKGWCLAYDYGEVEIVDAAPSTTPTAPDITTCGDCDLQFVAATCSIGCCPMCEATKQSRWHRQARRDLDRAADEARHNSGVAKLESPFSPRKIRGDGW